MRGFSIPTFVLLAALAAAGCAGGEQQARQSALGPATTLRAWTLADLEAALPTDDELPPGLVDVLRCPGAAECGDDDLEADEADLPVDAPTPVAVACITGQVELATVSDPPESDDGEWSTPFAEGGIWLTPSTGVSIRQFASPDEAAVDHAAWTDPRAGLSPADPVFDVAPTPRGEGRFSPGFRGTSVVTRPSPAELGLHVPASATVVDNRWRLVSQVGTASAEYVESRWSVALRDLVVVCGATTLAAMAERDPPDGTCRSLVMATLAALVRGNATE
ncbi:MAG TPA: hypothetical protein DHV14_10965 [Micrococcales bacterium]|uniref:hypothetical protein n=1 Tax=Miniimonas arenae TaxID=676201 RepID=UPI000EE99FB3|nr:hypothetical protein [Miniimonas arenae]HCX85632.1 hypothetical protein [Micrococcales bacterium]